MSHGWLTGAAVAGASKWSDTGLGHFGLLGFRIWRGIWHVLMTAPRSMHEDASAGASGVISDWDGHIDSWTSGW